MQSFIVVFLTAACTWPTIAEKVDAPQNLIGWKSAQALTLGLGVYGPDPASLVEFALIEFGAGFKPPLGLGIRGRLWTGESYSPAVASLRLSYTPYLSWKKIDEKYQEYARIDVFVEPGYTIAWWNAPLLRAGASFSFSPFSCIFPLSMEAGWAFWDDFDELGPYLQASVGAVRVEQPLEKGGSGNLKVVHQFSPVKDNLSFLFGFNLLTVGELIPQKDFCLRHGVNLELCALKAGIGLTPPVGLGISARVWAGALSDWWWAMPFVSVRATYSPFMVFQNELRLVRFDLFAEYGFVEDWLHTLRAGISTDLSFIPFLAPVSVEAGWASYPLWDSTRSGVFVLINVSAFGADYKPARREK